MADDAARVISVVAAIVLAVAGCSIQVVHTVASPSVAAASPTADEMFGVDNELTVPVTIFRNGAEGITVPAGTRLEISAGAFGPLPWSMEARSPSGRILLSLDVPAGAEISATAGLGARADLACGRLDLYVGPPMLGPTFVPDPSKPCD